MPAAAIEVDGLTKRYRDQTVVDNVAFAVRSGAVVRRHCATNRSASYTPSEVFVLPTSITRSITIQGDENCRTAANSKNQPPMDTDECRSISLFPVWPQSVWICA